MRDASQININVFSFKNFNFKFFQFLCKTKLSKKMFLQFNFELFILDTIHIFKGNPVLILISLTRTLREMIGRVGAYLLNPQIKNPTAHTHEAAMGLHSLSPPPKRDNTAQGRGQLTRMTCLPQTGSSTLQRVYSVLRIREFSLRLLLEIPKCMVQLK